MRPCANLRAGARWALALLALCAVSRPAAAQSYLGATRCRECHEFEYRVWASGPHARAQLALSADELRDAKCNTCHTMQPGSSDERFVGVQCEQCHGGGQFYHYAYVMKDKDLSRAVGLVDPSPAHCQRCHTEGAPSIEPFEFERAWARIDHGSKARERWQRARAQAGKGDGASR